MQYLNNEKLIQDQFNLLQKDNQTIQIITLNQLTKHLIQSTKELTFYQNIYTIFTQYLKISLLN